MSSRKQSKRAAFAHRRRKWRRIVAEFKAWPCPRHDDRVDFFQREFTLEDTLQAYPRPWESRETFLSDGSQATLVGSPAFFEALDRHPMIRAERENLARRMAEGLYVRGPMHRESFADATVDFWMPKAAP